MNPGTQIQNSNACKLGITRGNIVVRTGKSSISTAYSMGITEPTRRLCRNILTRTHSCLILRVKNRVQVDGSIFHSPFAGQEI